MSNAFTRFVSSAASLKNIFTAGIAAVASLLIKNVETSSFREVGWYLIIIGIFFAGYLFSILIDKYIITETLAVKPTNSPPPLRRGSVVTSTNTGDPPQVPG